MEVHGDGGCLFLLGGGSCMVVRSVMFEESSACDFKLEDFRRWSKTV